MTLRALVLACVACLLCADREIRLNPSEHLQSSLQKLASVLTAFQAAPGVHRFAQHAGRTHASRMQDAYGMLEPRMPSEKQIQYAQALGQRLGKEVPEDALQDSMSCSQFIDSCLEEAKPTERQIAFAQTIARDLGIEMPPGTLENSKACSQYISAHQHLLPGRSNLGTGTGMGMGMGSAVAGSMPVASGSGMRSLPTQNQILYAVQLAQQLNIGLAAEVLADKDAMSRFIDECQNGRRFTAPGAPLAANNIENRVAESATVPSDPERATSARPMEASVVKMPEYEVNNNRHQHDADEEPLPF